MSAPAKTAKSTRRTSVERSKMHPASLNNSPKPSKARASKATSAKVPARVELLFEIGAEEIPAGMLPRAVAELKTILEKHLMAENLMEGVTVETFGGPRRLIACARGLIDKQADVEMEVTGPPRSVAYDNVGAPTRAAVSFAEKQGVPLHELFLVTTPKGKVSLRVSPSAAGPPASS